MAGGRVCGVTLTSGAESEEIVPRVVVVADGALDRFGKALGVERDRRRPIGMAARTYYRSARGGDAYLDVHLGVRDGRVRLGVPDG